MKKQTPYMETTGRGGWALIAWPLVGAAVAFGFWQLHAKAQNSERARTNYAQTRRGEIEIDPRVQTAPYRPAPPQNVERRYADERSPAERLPDSQATQPLSRPLAPARPQARVVAHFQPPQDGRPPAEPRPSREDPTYVPPDLRGILDPPERDNRDEEVAIRLRGRVSVRGKGTSAVLEVDESLYSVQEGKRLDVKVRNAQRRSYQIHRLTAHELVIEQTTTVAGEDPTSRTINLQ